MENIQEELELLNKKIDEQILISKEFLDLEEVSRYLNLSKSALYKLTSKSEIPFYQPGGKKIFFKKSELHDWIVSN